MMCETCKAYECEEKECNCGCHKNVKERKNDVDFVKII
jgi:hypothetical protein